MRAKLALLIAASVVFAPGWPASAGSAAGPGDVLAGRILAPTVDEASVTSVAAAVNAERLERAKPRSGFSKAAAWRSAPSSPPSPPLFWGPLPAVAVATAAARAPSASSPRGPPHLLTA